MRIQHSNWSWPWSCVGLRVISELPESILLIPLLVFMFHKVSAFCYHVQLTMKVLKYWRVAITALRTISAPVSSCEGESQHSVRTSQHHQKPDELKLTSGIRNISHAYRFDQSSHEVHCKRGTVLNMFVSSSVYRLNDGKLRFYLLILFFFKWYLYYSLNKILKNTLGGI